MLERLVWSVIRPEPESDPLVVPVAEQAARMPNIDAKAAPFTSFLFISASILAIGKRCRLPAGGRSPVAPSGWNSADGCGQYSKGHTRPRRAAERRTL